MNEEEIKKIAYEICKKREKEEEVSENTTFLLPIDIYVDMLTKLSEDYAIVPKTQLKELYDCYKQHEAVSKEKGLYEAEMIARGSQATMRDIFGSRLFDEGGVMKTTLTNEQGKRLIELGVEPMFQFRLTDLFRILPKKITDRRNIYELRMGITDCLSGDDHWYVVYKDSRTDIDELESFQSAEELIDAVYAILVWIKTNKIKEL